MSLTFVVNGAGTFAAGIDTPAATFTGSFSALPGPAGTAATITVGTVSTLGPGDPATVVNSGTSVAAVLDFGIPEGLQGAPGVVAATAPLSYNAGTQTVSIDTSGFLLKAGNLSGLADASAARSNLGLGTMATATATDYLSKAGNLSGLADLAVSRTNLGLGVDDSVAFGSIFKGTVAGLQYSINPNDIWAGSYDGVSVTKTGISSSGVTFPDATVQATKGLIPASNLSDLANAATARTNLGLGTMAVESASSYYLASNPSGYVTSASAIRVDSAQVLTDAERYVARANANAPIRALDWDPTKEYAAGDFIYWKNCLFICKVANSNKHPLVGQDGGVLCWDYVGGSMLSSQARIADVSAWTALTRTVGGGSAGITGGVLTAGTGAFGSQGSAYLPSFGTGTFADNFSNINFSKPMFLERVVYASMNGFVDNYLTLGNVSQATFDPIGPLARAGVGFRFSRTGTVTYERAAMWHDGVTLNQFVFSTASFQNNHMRVAIHSDGAGNYVWLVNDQVVHSISSGGPSGLSAFTTAYAVDAVARADTGGSANTFGASKSGLFGIFG